MKVPMPLLGIALALVAGPAAAAATATPTATPPATSTDRLDHAALERKLEEARARLEQAAKEVAEISAGLVPDEETIHRLVGSHPHPMLGVQLGKATDAGVPIAGVSPGGAASEAGLAVGDVIISVNGRHVANGREVAAEIGRVGAGAEARIERSRDGKVATVVARPHGVDPRISLLLEGNKVLGDFAGFGDFGDAGSLALMSDDGMPWGELELVAMSPGLGRYFGTDRGVLVVRAPAAFGEELKDGDVILAIGGRQPDGVPHALRILRSYRPKEHVPLALERDRKAVNVELTMPERSGREFRFMMRGPTPPTPPAAPAAPPAMPAPPPPGRATSSSGGETT